MMKQIIVILTTVATMFFFNFSEYNYVIPEVNQSDIVTTNLSNKTVPSLKGVVHLDFTFTPPAYWNGTINFGAMGEYGITFFSDDTPRNYSQASLFKEDFIIYKLGSNWKNPINVYMKGWNSGVPYHTNRDDNIMIFRSRGKITEAYGPFEEWNGRCVHAKGTLEKWEKDLIFGWLPEDAKRIYRIN